MTSKLVVNTIESDAGVSTVTFASDISVTGSAGALSASTLSASTLSTTNLTVNGNAYPSAGSLGNRNKVINGAMQVSQRNGTSSVSETGPSQYTLDRWQVVGSTSAGVFSVEQSTDTPTGYINSLKVTVTTSSAASNADESYQLQQHIEGLNCSDLSFGSANAKTVTLSFWVKSSVTGTMGGVLRNANYDRTYPYEYTISSANTWEQKTITIPGDTTGTWLTTNNIGLSVQFGFGAGTNRQATANTWANTIARIPSGSTQLIATNGATWFVTGVQLEVGSVATPFERRSYGQELALCQRYYQKYTAMSFRQYVVNVIRLDVPLLVLMRDNPIVTKTYGSTSGLNADNTWAYAHTLRYDLQYSGGGSGVIDLAGGSIALSAEL